ATLARIPSLLACSFGGNALCSGNYGKAAAIFIITGSISIAGLVFYGFITKSKNKKPKSQD
ncbi:MAG TPA: hypothetical protein DIV41_09115, partial [Ruminococcaceae bacterium]|nr:hypothetical protein [Oscillospiraceae bacterium]